MRRKILLWALLALASAPPVFAAETLTRNINGGVYLGLSQFSRQNNLHYAWDPVVKNVTITGLTGRLKFHVGGEYALSPDGIVHLRSKTRFLDGEVWAPYIAKNILEPLTITKTEENLPQHRITHIVVDAGHGGQDYGALGLLGLKEKELVLGLAKKLRDELVKKGLRVTMTRDSDAFIPLSERARIANKTGADFFISIHANASPTRSLKGFETYTLSEATDDEMLATQRAENSVIKYESSRPEAESKEFKAIFWDLRESENRRESLRIADHVVDSVHRSVETATRRSKTANFYVLKWTECPAVLVETGYITNHDDALRLKSPIYRQRLVEGLAQGILRYKEEFERTDGFTK